MQILSAPFPGHPSAVFGTSPPTTGVVITTSHFSAVWFHLIFKSVTDYTVVTFRLRFSDYGSSKVSIFLHQLLFLVILFFQASRLPHTQKSPQPVVLEEKLFSTGRKSQKETSSGGVKIYFLSWKLLKMLNLVPP